MTYVTLFISSDALRTFILAEMIPHLPFGSCSLESFSSMIAIASPASAKKRSASLMILNEGTRDHRPQDSASPAVISQNAETHQVKPSLYARKVRIALVKKKIPFELLTEVPWDSTTGIAGLDFGKR